LEFFLLVTATIGSLVFFLFFLNQRKVGKKKTPENQIGAVTTFVPLFPFFNLKKERKSEDEGEDNGRDYRRMDSWAQVKSLINSLLGPGYPIRRLFH